MIIGELRDLDRPFVDCNLSLPRLGVAAPIRFLVDTGSDTTYLHPGDGVDAFVPFDLLQGRSTATGIGGSALYFPEPAELWFTDYIQRRHHGYRISINIAKPGDVNERFPSLLGRDVIRRWRMDYDPTHHKLEFTVRDADFTIDID